jgi:hypothetical protein
MRKKKESPPYIEGDAAATVLVVALDPLPAIAG